ncbi:MAG TPA: hypothetical protein VGI54_11400 [Solirubrobacteraceae bacterium]
MRRALLPLVVGVGVLAGCSSAKHASAPTHEAAATTTTSSVPRPTPKPKPKPAKPKPTKPKRHVAPLPPPVADPKPTEAVPTAATGVSPGAPSDAQVRAELRQALHLKSGASSRQLEDLAELTPDSLAVAPPSAPDAVDAIIRGGNRVAHAPYVYGGGHGTWEDSAYDCSGSVSFALANAGLLRRQLDSTALSHWGQPGPGRWVTIYANGGHAWMTVAGLRFDTSGRTGDRGSRWQTTTRSGAGFVARHPAGL